MNIVQRLDGIPARALVAIAIRCFDRVAPIASHISSDVSIDLANAAEIARQYARGRLRPGEASQANCSARAYDAARTTNNPLVKAAAMSARECTSTAEQVDLYHLEILMDGYSCVSVEFACSAVLTYSREVASLLGDTD